MSNYSNYYRNYRKEYRKRQKKSFSWIVYRIFVWTTLIFCTVALISAYNGRKNPDKATTFFGKQFRLILSDSMAECSETDVSGYKIKSLAVNSMVAIEVVPDDEQKAKAWYDGLQVGDVLTIRYVYVAQETITHRIVSITPKGEGYVITLQGDNKNSDADTLTQRIDTTDMDSLNYVVGKVIWQNYPIGVILSLLRKPAGIVLFVILPSMFLFACEIYVLSKRAVERKMRKRTPARRYYGNTDSRGGYYGNMVNRNEYYGNTDSRGGYYGNTDSRGGYYGNMVNRNEYYGNTSSRNEYYGKAVNRSARYNTYKRKK